MKCIPVGGVLLECARYRPDCANLTQRVTATKPILKLTTDGRFLCVEITNPGAPALFSAVIQPGRGTASAAIARTALWHHGGAAEMRIETNASALIRLAQRDRPPSANEDDDPKHTHPEGPPSWRMCFLRSGGGAALERVCPIMRRDGSSEHDGVILTLTCDTLDRPIVKSIELEGDRAIDADTGAECRVLDSPRHYHLKPGTGNPNPGFGTRETGNGSGPAI